jgi:hypothetical protein
LQSIDRARGKKGKSFLAFVCTMPLKPTLFFAFVVTLFHIELVANATIEDLLSNFVQRMIYDLMAVVLFMGWSELVDAAQNIMVAMADQAQETSSLSKSLAKMKSTRGSCVSFVGSEKEEPFSCEGRHTTCARVLSEITAIYAMVAKGLGLALCILELIEIDLSDNILIIGLGTGATTVMGWLHLSSAISSLVPLAISNPFSAVARSSCFPKRAPNQAAIQRTS